VSSNSTIFPPSKPASTHYVWSFSYPNFYFCNWKAVNKHLIFSSCNQTTNVMDLWVISQFNNGPKPDPQKWGTSLLIDTNVTHLGECLHDSKVHFSHFAVLFHSWLLIFTFYQKVPKHGKNLITTFNCTPGERYFGHWYSIQFPSLLYSPLLWYILFLNSLHYTFVSKITYLCMFNAIFIFKKLSANPLSATEIQGMKKTVHSYACVWINIPSTASNTFLVKNMTVLIISKTWL